MSIDEVQGGVAVMQNRLYAIGGYNGQERLNTVEVFDAKTKRWSKVAAMNCKEKCCGSCGTGRPSVRLWRVRWHLQPGHRGAVRPRGEHLDHDAQRDQGLVLDSGHISFSNYEQEIKSLKSC